MCSVIVSSAVEPRTKASDGIAAAVEGTSNFGEATPPFHLWEPSISSPQRPRTRMGPSKKVFLVMIPDDSQCIRLVGALAGEQGYHEGPRPALEKINFLLIPGGGKVKKKLSWVRRRLRATSNNDVSFWGPRTSLPPSFALYSHTHRLRSCSSMGAQCRLVRCFLLLPFMRLSPRTLHCVCQWHTYACRMCSQRETQVSLFLSLYLRCVPSLHVLEV